MRVAASGLLARNAAAPTSPFSSYRAPDGPARLLEDLVARDACGAFEPSASFAALDPATGDLQGFVLATRMGPDQGCVAQLAVAAETRRRGLGTGLLRRAMESLASLGCRSVHLTADQDNHGALALYRRCGFQERHAFPDLRLRA
jgi:ribosomal protein S18 acetylase RimI-like enzyme